MRIRAGESCGVIIDIQEKLFPAISNKEQLLNKIKILISGLRLFDIPMVATFQYIKGLGEEVNELKEYLGDYARIEKITFSCMEEETFSKTIEKFERKNVIITGIESHICVQQTVLDLLGSGYQAVVVSDCIGSRNDRDNQIAINRMRDAGAIITSCESILYELCERADHPNFRSLLKIIKL